MRYHFHEVSFWHLWWRKYKQTVTQVLKIAFCPRDVRTLESLPHDRIQSSTYGESMGIGATRVAVSLDVHRDDRTMDRRLWIFHPASVDDRDVQQCSSHKYRGKIAFD
ncbi:hypothetical protein RAM_29590 [Amycolatopsis mediterranei S699]|uniref:Uncharacterized protein n=1 Tax=Amycolatopsis mediterranei (strain S699) TaxID=713604 RepID=A0A9R0P151_AMYMS|nr:hypothetical protein RAM_29590 [Amycolatopsis mediterranei S699]